MMNARIDYARAEPREIVVGEEIPAELLREAREREERARERADEWEEASEGCASGKLTER